MAQVQKQLYYDVDEKEWSHLTKSDPRILSIFMKEPFWMHGMDFI